MARLGVRFSHARQVRTTSRGRDAEAGGLLVENLTTTVHVIDE
jgi:hypothetical protein